MEEKAVADTVPLNSPSKTLPSFESFTRKFLSSPLSNQIECPSCKSTIDFNQHIKWQGPDTFSCNNCDKYLSMRLVQRALRDLGILSYEITEM